MAGYLDQYGAGDERREKYLWRTIITVVVVAALAGFLYYVLHHHREQAVAKTFFNQLHQQDYASAYRTWGCSDPKNCSGYAYDKFLEDWGPKSSAAGQTLRIADSEGCNQGVIITVDGREERLWVDSKTSALSFSPFPRCPGKSALALMLHHMLAPVRKPFY